MIDNDIDENVLQLYPKYFGLSRKVGTQFSGLKPQLLLYSFSLCFNILY